MSVKEGDKGYAAMDYLILSGAVLFAVILLMLVLSERTAIANMREIDNTMLGMSETINTLLTLGDSSADTVVLTVPPIIELAQLWDSPDDAIDGKSVILITMRGNQYSYQMGQPLSGSVAFLETPGTYFLTLYSTNNEIQLVRCGDGVINGFEGCEQDSDCPVLKPDCLDCVCGGNPGGGGGHGPPLP